MQSNGPVWGALLLAGCVLTAVWHASTGVLAQARKQPPGTRARWLWRSQGAFLLISAMSVLLAGLLVVGTPRVPATFPIVLPSGRVYEGLEYLREPLPPMANRGVPGSMLRLRYYAQVGDSAGMRREADGIAGVLGTVADSAGDSLLVLQPTRAVLGRWARLFVWWDLSYRRQRNGVWARAEP